ncbi:hypothetical protein QYF61_016376 [Mycteria americana]|uniref:Integrase catalytic domain-containing protein n=1 Tax=Mycteria americana TaxID=33587 RepID=A0AAN7N9A2_MYCAM|nr:hypothetical protein QYF61_016376 [Mycteria americana]
MLTVVEATTRWLETYSVTHTTTQNTILGLEKQVMWKHSTPERIESDKGTHFQNNLLRHWLAANTNTYQVMLRQRRGGLLLPLPQVSSPSSDSPNMTPKQAMCQDASVCSVPRSDFALPARHSAASEAARRQWAPPLPSLAGLHGSLDMARAGLSMDAGVVAPQDGMDGEQQQISASS